MPKKQCRNQRNIEARLVEGARLKYEEEEYAQIQAEEEARLVKGTSLKAKE